MWGLFRTICMPFILFRSFAGYFRRGSRALGGGKGGRAQSRRRGRGGATLEVGNEQDLGGRVRPPDVEAEGDGTTLPPWVVWEGHDIRVPLTNPTETPRWFRITVTDLSPHEYEVSSPEFGVLQPDDMVRLDPGQGAEFSVYLRGDGANAQAEAQVFYVYVTAFVRASEDSQKSVVRRNRYEWVPAPKAEDIALTLDPELVKLRPWREDAELQAQFTNHTDFPVRATLTLERQDFDGKALDDAPEIIEIPDPVAPHHRVWWNCTLPKMGKAGDPFAVQASADVSVAGRQGELAHFEKIPAAQPVDVEWVPFLTVWKDWLILLVTIVGFIWLIWGFPIWWVKPVVRVTLVFPDVAEEGEFPPEVTPRDIKVTLQRWDRRDELALTPIKKAEPIDVNGNRAEYQAAYPAKWHERWCGWLFPWFGGRMIWHPFSRRNLPFVIGASSNSALLEAYDLEGVKQEPPPEHHRLDIARRRPFIDKWWITPVTAEVPRNNQVVIELQFELDSITEDDDEVRVVPIVNGTETTAKTQPIVAGKAERIIIQLTEYVEEGQECDVLIKGTALPSGKTAEARLPNAKRRIDGGYPLQLDFSASPNTAKLSVPASQPIPLAFEYYIYDIEDNSLLYSGVSGGESVVASIPMGRAEQDVRVEIRITDAGYLPVPSIPLVLKLGETTPHAGWQVIPEAPVMPEMPVGDGTGTGTTSDDDWVPADPVFVED